MKYVKIFNSLTEFNTNKYDIDTPYVVLIEEDGSVIYSVENTIPNNQIRYKSTDGNSIGYKATYDAVMASSLKSYYSGPAVLSETYDSESGYYVITFDQDITELNSELAVGASKSFFCVNETYGLTCGQTLQIIVLPSSVTNLGYGVFYGCSNLSSISLSSNTESIGDFAFQNCSSLASVTIPNSVTSIGRYAFDNCPLTTINIPNSVISISERAFYRCSNLISVTIPNSVTNIGDYTFYNCISLTSVTIPSSVASFGNWAFENCTGLTTVTISDGVTSIGGGAFCHCSGLTTVTIPNSVTSIGDYAFNGCTSLSSVIYKGTVYTSKSALTTALINGGVTAGAYVFSNTGLSD